MKRPSGNGDEDYVPKGYIDHEPKIFGKPFPDQFKDYLRSWKEADGTRITGTSRKLAEAVNKHISALRIENPAKEALTDDTIDRILSGKYVPSDPQLQAVALEFRLFGDPRDDFIEAAKKSREALETAKKAGKGAATSAPQVTKEDFAAAVTAKAAEEAASEKAAEAERKAAQLAELRSFEEKQRLDNRQYNPPGQENKRSFMELLEQTFHEGKKFNEFLEELFVEWEISDAKAFSNFCTSHLATKSGKQRQISSDTVRLMRNDKYRDMARPSLEPVENFVKAFHLDKHHEHMMWNMLCGQKFSLDSYDQLEKETIDAQNPAVLAKGLMQASGIPLALLNKSGVKRISETVNGGYKIEKLSKAERFAQLTMPARWRESDEKDPEILKRQQSATRLLSDPMVLKPVAMKKLNGKPTAKEILRESVNQKSYFHGFVNKLIKSWNIEDTKELSEIIAYNYQQATGTQERVWESTLNQWKIPNFNVSSTGNEDGYEDKKRKKAPHPSGIVVFRTALGMDEKDEMNMWRMISGRRSDPYAKQKSLDDIVDAAVASGNTGPLMKELVDIAGIPTGHLQRIIPTGMLHEWINGGKLTNEEMGKRFLELVDPVVRFTGDRPDPAVEARHKKILGAWKYKAVVDKDGIASAKKTVEKRETEHLSAVISKINERPFSDILEEACRERQRWSDVMAHVKESWGATIPKLSKAIAQLNTKNGGKTISEQTLYAWEDPDSPQIGLKAISPTAVKTLTDGFGLKDELHELMIWKLKGGEYLDKTKLDAVLVKAEKGDRADLVKLLIKNSGIQDKRLFELVGVTQSHKWEEGGTIQTKETARRLIEVTLKVDKWRMNSQAQGDFDRVMQPRLVRALTGRALNISDIVNPLNGNPPADSHEFIAKLCGTHGIRTLSDEDFCKITGIGEHMIRQVRRGRGLLTDEQAGKLLAHFDCTDGQSFTKAKAILAIKPPRPDRARSKQDEK